MSELTTIETLSALPLPAPRVAIRVRVATLADLPFIDGLQKKTSRQVGFMPTKQLEGKIERGEVLIAEGAGVDRAELMVDRNAQTASPLSTLNHQLSTPLGYCIAADRYFKHDDVGIIYAINVVPAHRRSLVAATLLKAQFERSAYGCKLYCCWCAQDLEANRFWESMGFVALAFRSGGRTSGVGGRKLASSDSTYDGRPTTHAPRTHIFWQKRIRAGDATTPWWFPSQTTGGSIREDRIVLPIPPGTHWSDAKPIVLPEEVDSGQSAVGSASPRARPGAKRRSSPPTTHPQRPTSSRRMIGTSPFQFASAVVVAPKTETPKPKAPRVKRKSDPRLVAAARELRDRWLEQVNESPMSASGKYDVTRTNDARTTVELIEPATLKALAA